MSRINQIICLIAILSVAIIMAITITSGSEHRKEHDAKCSELDGVVVYQKTKAGIHRTLCLNKDAVHYSE